MNKIKLRKWVSDLELGERLLNMTPKTCSTKKWAYWVLSLSFKGIWQSLEVQWLGLHTSNAGAQLPSWLCSLAMKNTCIYAEIPLHSSTIGCLKITWCSVQFSRSFVSDSATPWTAARQASLLITNSQSPPKPMSIEPMMPSNHLILCCPLLLLPSILVVR